MGGGGEHCNTRVEILPQERLSVGSGSFVTLEANGHDAVKEGRPLVLHVKHRGAH